MRASVGSATRRWFGAALLLSVITLLASAHVLAAHTGLRRSSPARGAHLTAVPLELRLTFTEAVERAGASLSLRAADGSTIALGDIAVPSDSTRQLVAAIVGPMTAGTYMVRWRIAGKDGHPVSGEFVFSVLPNAVGIGSTIEATQQTPTAEPPSASPSDTTAAPGDPHESMHHDPATFPSGAGSGFGVESPAFVAVRWLWYLALLGAIGALAFRFAVLGLASRHADPVVDSAIPTAAERAASIGLASGIGLLVAAVLRLGAQSIALHGWTADAVNPAMAAEVLGRTVWGWGWLLQVAAAAIALVGFTRARRHERSGWGLAAAAGLLSAFAPALSGHAAGSPRLSTLAIVADALHVIGAAGWLGSLTVLLLAGIPAAMRLGEEKRDAAVASLVNAFSPTALAFASLAALTGVFAGWLHLGNVAALWRADYGQVLLVKLAVLSVVVLTGAYNWLRVRPSLGDVAGTARLRRSAAIEIMVAVVVVAITAVLVATSPTTSAYDMARHAAIIEGN